MDIWQEITRFQGQTLHTLYQGKAFDILAVTDQTLIIKVHATGNERRIKRSEIDSAAKLLFSKGELTRTQIRDESSVANPAYVAAILANLAGVRHTDRPIIRLWIAS